LFQGDNLERFFDDYAKDHEQDDEPMLGVYVLSDYLNDFIHILFMTIIQSSLNKVEYLAHLGDIIEMWDDCHNRIRNNCEKLIDKLPAE